MIQIYFKLVDKIEVQLTLASWKKFKSLFKNEISKIVSKLNQLNPESEDTSVSLRFFDTGSNGFDLDDYVKETGKSDDWDISQFLRDSGLVFNLSLNLSKIGSLIEQDVLSNPEFISLISSWQTGSWRQFHLVW
jgi:hypothetical protein